MCVSFYILYVCVSIDFFLPPAFPFSMCSFCASDLVFTQ